MNGSGDSFYSIFRVFLCGANDNAQPSNFSLLSAPVVALAVQTEWLTDITTLNECLLQSSRLIPPDTL